MRAEQIEAESIMEAHRYEQKIFNECSMAYMRNRDPVAKEAIANLDKDVIADMIVRYQDDFLTLGRLMVMGLKENVQDSIENDDSNPINE